MSLLPEFLEDWGNSLELAMGDSRRAPDIPCPACNQSMTHEIGFGRLTGYICMGFGCPYRARISVENLCDPHEYQLFVEAGRMCRQQYDEMRQRNRAHDREKDSPDAQFYAFRDSFAKRHGLADQELTKELIAHQDGAIALAWRTELAAVSECYCTDCHGYHLPTNEHPACRLCSPGFVHKPMPPDIYFNYRGWKWTPPFICMGCGIEVCYRQWAFSRSCGPCDVSESKTRRLLFLKCFAGPHERLAEEGDGDIPEDHLVNPADRDKYPVMKMERPARFQAKKFPRPSR